jgi:hypothetical protein
MNTTTEFFNQDVYGSIIPTISSTNTKKNTVMIDSWLTTGGACNGYLGIPKAEDNGVGTFVNSNNPKLLLNNAAQAGIPLTANDGMIAGTVPGTSTIGLDGIIDVFGDGSANGNVFIVTNGAWTCLTGAVGPIGANNKVLIAQITTNGIFHFELNIQIGTPTGGTEKYVSANPGTGELTIPGLTRTLYPVPMLPVVNITSPVNNASFVMGMPLIVTADANDPDGMVSQVEFFIDGSSIGIDVSSPYEVTYTGLAGGSHVVISKATDNDGQFTVSDPVNFDISASTTLNLKAYLQGFWNGTSMNQTQDVDINFNVWNKWDGTTVDTLSVHLADANSPFGFVFAAHAVNIQTDGSVSLTVPSSLSDSYYITILHRSSIETWSASPISFTGGTVNYDFTATASQAFGSNLFDLNGDGSVWGMFGGEIYGAGGTLPADGYVDINDVNAVYNENVNGAYGYMLEDITGDGFVDINDFNMVYNNNVYGIGLNTPIFPMKRPIKAQK